MVADTRVKVRLSKVYDYDLWCLYKTIGNVAFTRMIKDILTCYINHTEYHIPVILYWETPSIATKEAVRVFNLRLKREEYAQILEELQKIAENKTSAFIKSVMRAYLSTLLLTPFYMTSESKSLQSDKHDQKNKLCDTQQKTRKFELRNELDLQNETGLQQDNSKLSEQTFNKKSTSTENVEIGDLGDLADLFGGFTVN